MGRLRELLAERAAMEATWARRKLAGLVGAGPRAEAGRLDFDWSRVPYDRRAVVGLIAHRIDAKRYLEIGCQDDKLFHTVWCPTKIGVDPARGGTHRMTSDEFFAGNTLSFDLVFIDGLHEYAQVRRDILNALDCLEPGGWIGVHDCLPRDWGAHQVPRQQFYWNGDVWRAIAEMKARADIDTRIVLVDHGTAIMRRSANSEPLDAAGLDFANLPFSWLVENHRRLGLIEFAELDGYLAAARAG
ncbi:MAG: class I SAM-dependent methyltransferase [Rhizobiales bacterium]|nr:class I SAM-dependent methyltransferase [Hyphomicrobiales bacterium]